MGIETPKLQGDLLREELKTLDTLETWGASLFLGAIALTSKQLIDWSHVGSSGTPVVLHAPIFLLPAALGFFAFVFLRVVNFRIRRIRRHVFTLAELAFPPKLSFGILGWLMSLMPPLLGYVASWYFAIGRPEVQYLFRFALWFGAFAILIAVAVFFLFSQARPAKP